MNNPAKWLLTTMAAARTTSTTDAFEATCIVYDIVADMPVYFSMLSNDDMDTIAEEICNVV